MLYLTIGKLVFYNKSLPYKVILPAFPVLMSMNAKVRKSGTLHLKKTGDYQSDVPKRRFKGQISIVGSDNPFLRNGFFIQQFLHKPCHKRERARPVDSGKQYILISFDPICRCNKKIHKKSLHFFLLVCIDDKNSGC
jgi:hypothetical protein